MNAVEEAKRMLKMAGKDLLALQNMTDEEVFSDAIFGFHAQQAAEKSLKAWITAFGEAYEYRHDLHPLLGKLKSLGNDVTDLMELVDLNTFAVQFRYEDYAYMDAPVDRREILSKVESLYDRVQRIIEEIEGRG